MKFLYIRGQRTLPFRARMKNGRSPRCRAPRYLTPRCEAVFCYRRPWALARGASLLLLALAISANAFASDGHYVLLNEAIRLLKARNDNGASIIFKKILSEEPDNLGALWGRAEVLRRARDYKQAEDLLNKILSKNPKHISSLISLSYIRYKDDKLSEALKLVNQVSKSNSLDKENQALVYMMLGAINSRRSTKGWLFSKIVYGTQIKGYFLKARELAPGLPEVHLGLGVFYLLAPIIAGGNLNEALKELEAAVKIAPDFATANARLAQAHKKKGDLEKYNFYLKRAEGLDPENEVLKELN